MFSSMQRGFINKEYIKYFVLIAIFFYDSISSIYYLLPPMFGILAILVFNALDEDDRYFLFMLLVVLLFFESNRNLLLFSTTLFLIISYYYFVPIIKDITICQKCLYPLYISLAYIGYFLFTLVLSFILNSNYISIDYVVIYYILIEIFLALVWL